MAGKIVVQLELAEDAAWALAQLAKRFTWEDANTLSDRYQVYADGRMERDHMLDAIAALQRALTKIGISPR